MKSDSDSGSRAGLSSRIKRAKRNESDARRPAKEGGVAGGVEGRGWFSAFEVAPPAYHSTRSRSHHGIYEDRALRQMRSPTFKGILS
ncbi:hypothetical protein Pmani_012190 [Petrolisthes manimaculis]|uniref:Uncharacterized protein n=1 Tax=Petrolisthes manimaculis TaxID=1843537 RepID=A0AAE1PXX6_9EUCA|nr:hypothetical protein Pmani_012190 [Petrolisthes manimaculis]